MSQTIVKSFAILRKKPDMTTEAFRDHWQRVHGPLVARLPGLIRYVQYHVHSVPREGYQPQDDPIDGIVEAWFASAEAVQQLPTTPEYQAVLADERTFLARSDHFNHGLLVDETVEILPTLVNSSS